MPKKLAEASWHTPVLGVDCPYCGEWDDYFDQYQDHDYPFEMMKSEERKNLKGIEFTCINCKKDFELSSVSW